MLAVDIGVSAALAARRNRRSGTGELIRSLAVGAVAGTLQVVTAQ